MSSTFVFWRVRNNCNKTFLSSMRKIKCYSLTSFILSTVDLYGAVDKMMRLRKETFYYAL